MLGCDPVAALPAREGSLLPPRNGTGKFEFADTDSLALSIHAMVDRLAGTEVSLLVASASSAT